MKSYGVGELKANLAAILGKVRRGEHVGISFGRKREPIAVIVPYAPYAPGEKRKLGILKGKAVCVIRRDFAMTDAELFRS